MTDPAVAKLQALVRIPTISQGDPADRRRGVRRVPRRAARSFPLLHQRLELTPVTDHGLLFRWPGRDDAKPVVLMAHLDVVPVDGDATWQHPPFGADIVDGEIWGRGTLDDKGALVGICEAVERLARRRPRAGAGRLAVVRLRRGGARRRRIAAVEMLEQRGVRPWFVLDEGGAVAHHAFPAWSRRSR